MRERGRERWEKENFLSFMDARKTKKRKEIKKNLLAKGKGLRNFSCVQNEHKGWSEVTFI